MADTQATKAVNRILIDIRHLTRPNPAGVGRYTINLLEALFQLESRNEYILFSSGKSKSEFGINQSKKHQHVHYVHVDKPNKLLNLQTLATNTPSFLPHISNKIDRIFLPNLNIVNLHPDIPTTLTVHDTSWELYPEFFSRQMRLWHKASRPHKLFKKVESIVTPSHTTAQDLITHFSVPSTKTSVIPHGIELDYSHRMKASDHGTRSRLKLPARFALFVGTHEPRKNLLALIEGVKTYREQTNDDLHLVLAGNWGWKSHAIKRRLWKQDVNPWIHHKGYVEQTDLPALYRSATVTLFPSIYEGFGFPVLESLACGTPCITSHASSLPEVGADACLYIDPYNSNDLAHALQGLISSESLQQELIQKGVKQAQKFTWEQAAKQTLELLNTN